MRFGRPTGMRSSRADVWSRIDAGRTARPAGDDPVEAWTRYAMAARVLLVRCEDGPWVPDPGMTVERWRGVGQGRVQVPKLRLHASTSRSWSTVGEPARPSGVA